MSSQFTHAPTNRYIFDILSFIYIYIHIYLHSTAAAYESQVYMCACHLWSFQKTKEVGRNGTERNILMAIMLQINIKFLHL